jgi:hypothetical protein
MDGGVLPKRSSCPKAVANSKGDVCPWKRGQRVCTPRPVFRSASDECRGAAVPRLRLSGAVDEQHFARGIIRRREVLRGHGSRSNGSEPAARRVSCRKHTNRCCGYMPLDEVACVFTEVTASIVRGASAATSVCIVTFCIYANALSIRHLITCLSIRKRSREIATHH